MARPPARPEDRLERGRGDLRGCLPDGRVKEDARCARRVELIPPSATSILDVACGTGAPATLRAYRRRRRERRNAGTRRRPLPDGASGAGRHAQCLPVGWLTDDDLRQFAVDGYLALVVRDVVPER